MATRCSIRESTSSIPRTVIASGGWNEKLAENTETVRIYPERGTTTGAFLTTGGHFIKNERIPAAQCAGTLSLHNLYLLQVPAKGWSCFCRKNLGTNTRPCVVPIIAPGISQKFHRWNSCKIFSKNLPPFPLLPRTAVFHNIFVSIKGNPCSANRQLRRMMPSVFQCRIVTGQFGIDGIT